MAKHKPTYRGRIAPTPTGFLHLGHGRTFWVAWKRARLREGQILYREEDLDPQRCRPEFARAAREDLRWLGLDWDAGPENSEIGEEYRQSFRHTGKIYLKAWQRLKEKGLIYPCSRSRREIAEAAQNCREDADSPDEEPLFPGEWRPAPGTGKGAETPGPTNWRFRVPQGSDVSFQDSHLGPTQYRAGEDFGDFLVWRKDGYPAYELAVVVDDAAMGITEVVRGADLLKSTGRQLLLYEALSLQAPAFFHCPLVRDDAGRRLAKRSKDMGLRHLRERGVDPADLRKKFSKECADWISD